MTSETNFFDTFTTEITSILFEDNYFPKLKDHVFDIFLFKSNHKHKLIKLTEKKNVFKIAFILIFNKFL